MSARAGWYPDSQVPGRLRYWDGRAWTEHTSPMPPLAPGWTAPNWTTPTPGQPQDPAVPQQLGAASPGPARRGPHRRSVLAGGAGVLVLVLLVGWISGQNVRSGPSARGAGSRTAPSSAVPAPLRSPQQSLPPSPSPDPATPVDSACQPVTGSGPIEVQNGRVSVGRLSMPIAQLPFPAPVGGADVQFPLVEQVAAQSVQVAQYKNGGWAAAIIAAQLPRRNDVGSARQAAELLSRCMVQTQYGVRSKTHRQVSSAATTVSQRAAWQIEYQILMDDPDLSITEETGLITAVDLGQGRFGFFWASIPQLPDGGLLLRQARSCQRGLKVS